MSLDKTDTAKKNKARRKLLRSLAAGGGVMATGTLFPKKWTTPIVDAVVLPAHAQASGPRPFTGNFGPGMMSGARNDTPSVLDLVVSPAHASASYAAQTGNVQYNIYWRVSLTNAVLCGNAQEVNSTATTVLSGVVNNNNGLLGPFQQNVGNSTLRFDNQRPGMNVLTCTVQSNGDMNGLVAPRGGICPIQTNNIRSTSPYSDDEEIA